MSNGNRYLSMYGARIYEANRSGGSKEVALLPFKTVNSKIQISRGYLQPTAEGRNTTNPAQRFTLTLVITEGEKSYQIVEI